MTTQKGKKTNRISFHTTPEEGCLIAKIVCRAAITEWFDELYRKEIDCIMDITAVHANGCPLNLQKLLDAPDYDFSHDIVGIHGHLDRKTGKLMDCFDPRCSSANGAL